MKKVNLFELAGFGDLTHKSSLVHDSPYLKIISFNFKAGQGLPIHSHEAEGQVCITVVEGRGAFLGKEESKFPAEPGDVLICDISEPHGVQAKSDMRILVTIAPPI